MSRGARGIGFDQIMTDDAITPITCQGIFASYGQDWKRLRKIGYRKFTRDRKIFFPLNIPNISSLSDQEIADSIIIDIIFDEGLESERIITDASRAINGYRSPATEQEVTDNPGKCVWIGWVEIPRYAEFSTPTSILKDGKVIPLEGVELHNITVKAAFRDIDNAGQRIFDAAHGAVVQRYDYEIVDDSNGPEYQPPKHGPARQD